jgi:hypothetical protein
VVHATGTNAAGGHIEIDHEGQGAVALVFELAFGDFAGRWRQIWCKTLASLNVGQFVRTDGALTHLGSLTGLPTGP